VNYDKLLRMANDPSISNLKVYKEFIENDRGSGYSNADNEVKSEALFQALRTKRPVVIRMLKYRLLIAFLPGNIVYLWNNFKQRIKQRA
jgi:hypothetical protein